MHYGETFLIRAKGRLFDSHLWIVISDPAADAVCVVAVNLTTHRADKDQACVIEAGEHSWVTHTTCVEYAGAKLLSAAMFDDFVKKGMIVPQADASDALVEKILAGCTVSEFMPLGALQVLVNQGLVDGD